MFQVVLSIPHMTVTLKQYIQYTTIKLIFSMIQNLQKILKQKVMCRLRCSKNMIYSSSPQQRTALEQHPLSCNDHYHLQLQLHQPNESVQSSETHYRREGHQ